MKKRMAAAGLCCMGMLLTGCVMSPGGIAPSSTPINGRAYKNLGRATKTDSRVHLFGFIPLSGANTTRDAIDAAVRSRDGDAMINITVESYNQWFLIITRSATRVDGDVIKFSQ